MFHKHILLCSRVNIKSIINKNKHFLFLLCRLRRMADTRVEFSVRPELSRVQERTKQSDMRINNESRTRNSTLGLVLSFCTLFTLSGCKDITVLTEVFRLETLLTLATSRVV